MTNVKELISKINEQKPLSGEEEKLIEKAFAFAQKAHEKQKRISGEPYFNHCFHAALKLAEWRLDPRTVAAGLLHDVIEDTGVTLEEIKKEFSAPSNPDEPRSAEQGEEIAFLVDGVTKLGHLKYHGVQAKAENLRKMIFALSKDLRVVFIKLADRLHNMKTLRALPPQKQKRISLETSEIYAPLAHRLGMGNLAGELEDLAFPYLYPKEYQWLKENVKERLEEREKYLEKVKDVLEKTLAENGIKPIKIDSRAKRYSSLYKKLVRHDMNLEQIYDLVALRIIVENVEQCYAVLGIIHQLWPPLPGRIKDYIALPKPNGYQSLHTTIFCLENKPTEFQIRTMEMHEKAENGIAAYWAYAEAKKNNEKKTVFAGKKELDWVNQLREWQSGVSDSNEFIQSLKIDFLKDRIFAITPQGEAIDLPAGSTPVDFAYAIHTEIGNQTIGARINNKIAPLDYQLQSGDLVDILTQKSKKPSESWLGFVKTGLAKKNIKSAIKKNPLRAGEKRRTEFNITVEDRVGILKDISSAISRSHINISSVNVPQTAHFPIIKIRCDLSEKEKAEKTAFKLRRVKGVREVNYRLI